MPLNVGTVESADTQDGVRRTPTKVVRKESTSPRMQRMLTILTQRNQQMLNQFRTATGELVKSGERLYVEGCDDWGVNLRVRGVQALVCKPLLSVGEYTTMGGVTVLYGDNGYMFHKGSNVAKKIDAVIQKEMRDSQNYGCTVAYKKNNVYNIYMKPRGNKTDAMPLFEDSDNRSSGGCRLGPNL